MLTTDRLASLEVIFVEDLFSPTGSEPGLAANYCTFTGTFPRYSGFISLLPCMHGRHAVRAKLFPAALDGEGLQLTDGQRPAALDHLAGDECS
jgi:hypothetical protein